MVFLHYFLHLIAPLAIAKLFFKSQWSYAYFLMLLTMLIDLDHLLANPIFDPMRCSIGFHPLHSFYALLLYIGLLFFKGTWRILGVGFLFHLFTDLIDCLYQFHYCAACYSFFHFAPFF